MEDKCETINTRNKKERKQEKKKGKKKNCKKNQKTINKMKISTCQELL